MICQTSITEQGQGSESLTAQIVGSVLGVSMDRVRVMLGDTDNTTGVGLGLALSRGLTEAMGGTLTADDTPGGGLTMTVSVPAVTGPGYEPEPGQRERESAGGSQ